MMDVSMIHGVEAVTGSAATGGQGGPKFLAKWWSLLRGKRHFAYVARWSGGSVELITDTADRLID